MAKSRPSGFKRLLGIDRSGPPPVAVTAGEPWRVWTIPNAIGFLRLGAIAPFLILAFGDEDGRTTVTAILAGIIGFGDYFDGLAARITGQYSRLGALLDPLIDRLLVVSGAAVCFHFELLPRWALVALVGRELLVLAVARFAIGRGLTLRINWMGRLAVWPVMSSLFIALMTDTAVAPWLLYAGLGMTLIATAQYANSVWMGLPPRRAGS